ncbi:MAG: hypothetical protein IT304_10420 [Dehalococcoidia bacterium]|nr:hypothetical protein [Dehalococcoidia bacterium]
MSHRLRLLLATLLAVGSLLIALLAGATGASAKPLGSACAGTDSMGGAPFSLGSTGSLRFDSSSPLFLPDGWGGAISGAASVSYSLTEVMTTSGMKGSLTFRASFDNPSLGIVTFTSDCVDLVEISYGFIDGDFHGTLSGNVYMSVGGSIQAFEDFNYWPGTPAATVLLITSDTPAGSCSTNGGFWWSWGVGSSHSSYNVNQYSWWRDVLECA